LILGQIDRPLED